MITPKYVAGVSHLTAGWSYTATEGADAGKKLAQLADVILIDPMSAEWGYDGDMIPGQLRPSQVTFTLAARSAGLMPRPKIGELVSAYIRIGTTVGAGLGPYLFKCSAMRVTAANLTLVEDENYPVQLVVTASDLLVDLPSTRAELPVSAPPNTGFMPTNPIQRFMWIARAAARSLGLPTFIPLPTTGDQNGWPSGTIPTNATFSRTEWGPDNLAEQLTLWCNGNGKAERAAMVVSPSPSVGYPQDYRWPGTVHSGDPDPGTATRCYVLSPSRPYSPLSEPLPLRLSRFGLKADMLSLVGGIPRQVSTSLAANLEPLALVLDARWCELPVSARASREHAPNGVRLTGVGVGAAVHEQAFTTDYLTADAAATGPRPRDVPTLLALGELLGDTDINNPPEGQNVQGSGFAINTTAAPFLASDAALNSPYAYDEFTVYPERMPQNDALYLLKNLAFGYPGESSTADNNHSIGFCRHLTIINVDPRRRLDQLNPASGWLVGAQLTIADGELVYRVRLQPGRPDYPQTTGVSRRISVGDVQDIWWGNLPCGDIDRNILVSDLRYVAPPIYT